MDKNTITGFVLIAAVLIGFSLWSQPSQEELAQQQEKAKMEAIAKEKEKEAKEKALALAEKAVANTDTAALFYKAYQGTEQQVVLKNEKLALTLNTKGGVVEKAVIANFKDRQGSQHVTLFDKNTQNLSYSFATRNGIISTRDFFFTPTAVTDTSVTFVAEAGQGKSIKLIYRLGKNYMLHASVVTEGMAEILDPNAKTLDINWYEKATQQEKGFVFENRNSTLTYHFTDGGTDYLSETSEVIEEKIEKTIDWVAFKNQFFSAVMITKNNFANDALLTSIPQEKGTGFLKEYQAKLKTSFDPTGQTPTEFEFYYGPNDFRLLKQIEEQSTFNKELELQRLVYLGWPLFRIINRWFTIYVFDWLTGLNINMGIVLILITLLLKFITYPLVKKSYMSSAKMRVLKPKLDEITKEYNKPEDAMKKQQAMMSEYAKYGVSPLSGCLPMLIQAPIWIAMFNFVPNAIQLRGEKFLWINDLSTYDPIIEWNTNLWLIGDHLSLTCILFCVANVLYTMMSMRQQKDQMVGAQAEQMKMMQWMMYLMPVMFFFMFNDYSSGLNFYYFISLFFSAAIMWLLRKTTNDEKLLAILEANYQEAKNNPQKLKGLAARLQAMQQQQEELQRRRNGQK
ncbi:MAG: membrane protein insertase YidC [Prevotellaceae bacterium]|nr:membrane protein insertase YidC [Prevotellaceae bacterium]MDY3365679.1 membrane protein insertase YidC [Prevotella sp.]